MVTGHRIACRADARRVPTRGASCVALRASTTKHRRAKDDGVAQQHRRRTRPDPAADGHVRRSPRPLKRVLTLLGVVAITVGLGIAAAGDGPAPRAAIVTLVPSPDTPPKGFSPAAERVPSRPMSPAGSAPFVGDATPSWAPPPARSLVLAAATGDLPDGYATRAAAQQGVDAVTVVRAATLELVRTRDADGRTVDELPDDWRYPLEVLAVDAQSYAAAHGAPAIARLGPDEVALGTTSAALRRIGIGGSLEFRDGHVLRVAAVLPDDTVGAAEGLVTTDAALPVDRARFLLASVADDTDPATVVRALEALTDEPITVRSDTEVTLLRHGVEAMPPAHLKWHFGEFALTDGPGRWFQHGASWQREHWRVDEVPLLGELQCHHAMFAPLSAAMQELVDRGLAHHIDVADTGGCWAPRTYDGVTPSSHAWGMAIDLNVAGNHYGYPPTIDAEVVAVMQAHGFVWGGDWAVPDGMHFELHRSDGAPDPTATPPVPDPTT